jgi:hypothetical protein
MITILIGCLLGVVLFAARLWRNLKSENNQLRSQVASLRRQITRNTRG